MKIFTAVICFFLLPFTSSSQSNAIDSLDKLISKSTSDTARINLLNKKITLIGNSNLDSAISLGKRTIDEAVHADYKKGEGATRIELAKSYCFKGEYKAADENLKLAETIFKQLKDSMYIGRLYAAYGMMYGMQSKYDTAISFYKQSIAVDERNHNIDEIARSYNNLAISYQMQSNFSQALEYQQKSLKLAEDKNDEVMQARTLLNMGITYRNMNDTGRSEQSLLKAVELAKKQHLKNVELYGYSNLASLYEFKNELQKSYDYALKSAELGAEMGDQGIQSTGLSKAAAILAKQKRFTEAEELSKRSVSIADSSNQPLNIYQASSYLGYVYKAEGKYAEAIPFYEKAFAALKGSDIYDQQIGVSYSELAECYDKTGNYKKALETYKQSVAIADSVSSKENVRKATELTLNYEFEKKQQAVAAEQKEKDAVAKTRQIGLMAGLGFVLVVTIIIFIGYYNKQRANALLHKQKAEINNALTKLRATQAQLIQAEKMASLGELTAGIAHEIQNPLNFVNNFSEVNTELIDEMDEAIDKGNNKEVKIIAADIKQNLEKITHHGKRADAIVKGMLQHSRTSSGQKEITDINALCEEYLRLAYHGLRAKDKSFNAKFESHFDENIKKINIVPQDIGRVILNLINNAFYAVNDKKKASQNSYEPTVTVTTKAVNNKIEIKVKDNGNGIPQTVIDKIFQPFFTTKPPGEGTGLGLSLSYDIIKAHSGELKATTIQSEGSEFTIELPVS